MDKEQFATIASKLDTLASKLDSLTKLLAFNIIKDKTVTEQVDILTKAGLRPKEIAEIIGKTENQVYVTQSNLRKKKKAVQEYSEQPAVESPADGGGQSV